MWNAKELSRHLLESTLRQFTPIFGLVPRVVNPLAARYAAEASILLGFHDLASKFETFANQQPENSEVPDQKMWIAFTAVRELSEIQEDHLIIDDEYLEKHVDELKSQNARQALLQCPSPYEKECLLLTLIVRGQITPALELGTQFTPERIANIQFVAAIEAFRWGQEDTGSRLLRLLPKSVMCEWGKPQMAIGITGRAAWPGYPYPDY